jgi:hypothetical protein
VRYAVVVSGLGKMEAYGDFPSPEAATQVAERLRLTPPRKAGVEYRVVELWPAPPVPCLTPAGLPEVLPCPKCKGSGIDPHPRGEGQAVCDRCKGTGQVILDAEATESPTKEGP